MPGIGVRRLRPERTALAVAWSVRRPLLLLLCLIAAACGRAATNVELAVQLHSTPATPVVDQETSIQVTLRDGLDQPVSRAALKFEAHMQHPGMAPVIADATERAAGIYAARMTFTMPGEWVVYASGSVPPTAARMRVEIGRLSVRAATP